MSHELLQTFVVLAIVGWSLAVTLRRYLPAALQQALAHWLQTHGWPRLGAYLLPVGGGCGGGCNSCQSGCTSAVTDGEQAVQWRK